MLLLPGLHCNRLSQLYNLWPSGLCRLSRSQRCIYRSALFLSPACLFQPLLSQQGRPVIYLFPPALFSDMLPRPSAPLLRYSRLWRLCNLWRSSPCPLSQSRHCIYRSALSLLSLCWQGLPAVCRSPPALFSDTPRSALASGLRYNYLSRWDNSLHSKRRPHVRSLLCNPLPPAHSLPHPRSASRSPRSFLSGTLHRA